MQEQELLVGAACVQVPAPREMDCSTWGDGNVHCESE